MVLVIWGVDGLALVEIVSSNLRVGAKYLCEFAISHMEANGKTHRPEQNLKGITFNSDNAPNHIAEVTIAKISESRMNQMPHLPYSPGIAPTDFFLFRHLKHKFQGCSYDSADELFSVITDLMENLEKSLLYRVFDEWISHLHLVVESDGEHA
jgi:histone-lysine N-methyltransferase SETMAR